MKRSILGSLALSAAFAAAPFITFAQDVPPGGTPPKADAPRGGVNDPLKTPKQAPRPVPPAPLNEAGAMNDLEGKQAPELSLQDLYGQTHSIAMHRGQVVVLHWIDPTKMGDEIGQDKQGQGAQGQGAQGQGTQGRLPPVNQGPGVNQGSGSGTQGSDTGTRGAGSGTSGTQGSGSGTQGSGTTDRQGAGSGQGAGAGSGQGSTAGADRQNEWKEMMTRYKAQGVKFLFVVSFDGKQAGASGTSGAQGSGSQGGLSHEQGNQGGAQGDRNKPSSGTTTPQGGRQTGTGQQGDSQPGSTQGGSSAPGGARQTNPPVGIDDDELAGQDRDQADKAFVLHMDRQQVIDASADLQSKLGPEFPILLDDGAQVAARYKVQDAPYAFIIDRTGKIAFAGSCDEQGGDKRAAKAAFERELNDVVRGLSVPASAPRSDQGEGRRTGPGTSGTTGSDSAEDRDEFPRNAPGDTTPRIEEDKPNDE